MTGATSRRSETLWRMRVRQAIAEASDRYFTEARPLAEALANRVKTNQIRGLENVAYATDKVSDILDAIKLKIGRRAIEPRLGDELLQALMGLRSDADRIAREVQASDLDLARRVHLDLCREFLKHVAAHFIYQAMARPSTLASDSRG